MNGIGSAIRISAIHATRFTMARQPILRVVFLAAFMDYGSRRCGGVSGG